MSLTLTLVLLAELSVHTFAISCGTSAEPTAQCVEAAVNPTVENGGKFVDDMPQIASGDRLGWTIVTEKNDGVNTVNNQISVETSTDPDTFYIGPFNGDTDTSGITTVTRDFACSKDSIARLIFTYYQCGGIDGLDDSGEIEFRTDILDYAVMTASTKFEGRVIGRDEPNTVVMAPADTILRVRDSCDAHEDWTSNVYGEDSPIALAVNADETFTVSFKLDYSTPDDNAAFGGIMVICTANDADGDGIADDDDNCPMDANADQADLDKDDIGDECDEDIDGDEVLNEDDDCPNEAGSSRNRGCPKPRRGGRGDQRRGESKFKSGSSSRSGSSSNSSRARNKRRDRSESKSSSTPSSSSNSRTRRSSRSERGVNDKTRELVNLLRAIENKYRG